jgi:steroid 5-alpha reductase family enzyme
MSAWAWVGGVAAGMVVAQTLGWAWQRRRDNAGIVDVIWAAGVGASAIVYALLGDGTALPRLLVALLGGIWGLRLAAHLWVRVRGEEEDGRYRQLRQAWNGSQWKFYAFFQFQALLVLLFSLPFLAVARNPVGDFTVWTALGIAIWLGSVGGEALADRQLARFKADPSNKGRVCDVGLWRYSRHPNYFFQWLTWVAYALIALAAPYGWLALSAPALMLYLIVFVTGVPPAEEQALRSRGDDYRRYQRETSAFVPLPRRSGT